MINDAAVVDTPTPGQERVAGLAMGVLKFLAEQNATQAERAVALSVVDSLERFNQFYEESTLGPKPADAASRPAPESPANPPSV